MQTQQLINSKNYEKATAVIKQMYSLNPEDESIKVLLDKIQSIDQMDYVSWINQLIEDKLEDDETTKIKVAEELLTKAKLVQSSVLIPPEIFPRLVTWIWDRCTKEKDNFTLSNFLINYSSELCIQKAALYTQPSSILFSLLESNSDTSFPFSVSLNWISFFYQLLNQSIQSKSPLSETYFIQFAHFVINLYSTPEIEDGSALVKLASLVSHEDYAKCLTKETAIINQLLELICLTSENPLYGSSLLTWTKLVSHDSTPPLLFPAVGKFLDKKFMGSTELDRLKGHRLLKTIFHFYPPWGIQIVSQEGWLGDAIETFEVETEQIQLTMLEWLSLCCNDTKFRPTVQALFDQYSSPLLNSSNASIKLSAILIQAKLQPNKIDLVQIKSVVELFSKEENSSANLSNTIEVIAYSSVKEDVKSFLASDAKFWRSCFKYAESGKLTNPVIYGICTVLSNISSYPVPLTKEQRQVKQLQAISQNSGQKDKKAKVPTEEEQQQEFDRLTELARQLNRKLVTSTTLDLWQLLSKSSQFNIWSTAINVMLGWATDSQLHSKLLQRGVVPSLLSKLPKVAGTELISHKITIIQTLSKLSIHTNPQLAFNQQTPWDLIALFVSLLDPKSPLNSQSNPLQRFEAVMALTNLTSLGPEYRDKVFTLGAVPNLELMMLSDHPMLRRTATECLCNLAYCQSGMDYYTKHPMKLHPMMAMTQIDDQPTRLAAGGAMASLSQLPPMKPILINHSKLHLMADCLDWDSNQDPNQGELLRAVEFWFQLTEHCKQTSELDKMPKAVKTKIDLLKKKSEIQAPIKAKIESIANNLN